MTRTKPWALALPLLFGCSAASSAEEPGSTVPGSGGSGGSVTTVGSGGGAGTGGGAGIGNGGTGGAAEACDGYDDDGDGQVDEGCVCMPGATQACFPFAPELASIGICGWGTQTCEGGGEFGSWSACDGATGPRDEVCGDGIDDDCDGADLPCGSGGAGGSGGSGSGCQPSQEICGNGIDEDCNGVDAPCDAPICQSISLFGDCLTASCPANAPYPESCQVFFTPGDDRGCVASVPTSPVVYFQAGDECNAGFVSGTLCCSTTPKPPLTQQTCPINKPQPIHVASKTECPAVTD